MKRIGVLLATGALLLAAPARADIESELVKSGVKAFDDLDYPKAIADLEKAIAEGTLTREERIATWRTLAFAHVASGDQAKAKEDFVKLLKIDRNFELDRTISPRVRAAFDEAKGEVAAMPAAAPPVLQDTSAELHPTQPQEGEAVRVSAYFPGGVAVTQEVFYRHKGQASYSKVHAEGKLGRFEVTIPGMDLKSPGIEYYMRILDDAGNAVGGSGSEAQPLSLDVGGRKVSAKAVAVGVGVVVVIGAVVGIVVAVVASKPGPNSPAAVTILPQ